jgi:hypothetical protein
MCGTGTDIFPKKKKFLKTEKLDSEITEWTFWYFGMALLGPFHLGMH